VLLIGFELLTYWQIVKDRKYPIGFNVMGIVEASRSKLFSLLPDAYVDGVPVSRSNFVGLT